MTRQEIEQRIDALTAEIGIKSNCGHRARHAGNEALAQQFYAQCDDRIRKRHRPALGVPADSQGWPVAVGITCGAGAGGSQVGWRARRVLRSGYAAAVAARRRRIARQPPTTPSAVPARIRLLGSGTGVAEMTTLMSSAVGPDPQVQV